MAHAIERARVRTGNISWSVLSRATMLDPRWISALPALCVLACTASHPDARDRPDGLVIADDLDTAPTTRYPRVPTRAASTPGEGAIPPRDTGLVGSGGSTSQAERGGYSGSRGFERFGGRGTRIPTVRPARLEVVGALDEGVLRRAVRAHVDEVLRCYHKALARDPNAKGRVAVAFEIDVEGEASSATVHQSTMKDPAVGDCIAAAAAGWKFAKPRAGTVKVVCPFVLEPG